MKMEVSKVYFLNIKLFAVYNLPKDKIAGNSGILTVMSRVNGWLTVTPSKGTRTKPLERESPKNNPKWQKTATD